MLSILITLVGLALILITSIVSFTLVGYMRYTAYANALILNCAWYFVGLFGGDTFHVWYPRFTNSNGKNFLIVTLIVFAIVFIINKFPKVRVSYYISSSVSVGLLLAILTLAITESKPSVSTVVFLLAFTVVTVVLQLGAIKRKEIDDSGNVVARVFAAVLLVPAPFILGLFAIDTLGNGLPIKTEILIAVMFATIVSLTYNVIDYKKDRKESLKLYDA